MKVISRLSTAVFRNRPSDSTEVSACLGANYIVSGAYVVNAGRVLITAELSSARDNEVVWAAVRQDTAFEELNVALAEFESDPNISRLESAFSVCGRLSLMRATRPCVLDDDVGVCHGARVLEMSRAPMGTGC